MSPLKLSRQALVSACLAKGWNAQTLASKAGISQPHLSNVMAEGRARRKGVSPAALKRIARALGVSQESLLADDTDSAEDAA